MSTTTKTPRQKSSKAHKKAQLVQDLSQLKMLGECVCWGGVAENWGKKNTRTQVEQALTSAGLDPKLAKVFSWELAFSRTCNELKEDKNNKRVIDVVRDDKDEILFQLSRKHEKDDLDTLGVEKEVEWKKETKILLNKTSGHLSSKNPRILEIARELLKKHKEERTTSDISIIVGKLFAEHSDLIPIAHGVYFVPEQYTPFTDQVHTFMRALGREMSRLPIPAGTQHGDQTVCNAVVTHIDNLLEELTTAVSNFSLTTQQNTVVNTASRINAVRSKLEAYATILGDKKDLILEKVEEANTQLITKLEGLEEERKTAPVEQLSNRDRVYAAMNGEFKTVKELCETAGTNTNGIGVYLDGLVTKGLAERVGNKFRRKISQ